MHVLKTLSEYNQIYNHETRQINNMHHWATDVSKYVILSTECLVLNASSMVPSVSFTKEVLASS